MVTKPFKQTEQIGCWVDVAKGQGTLNLHKAMPEYVQMSNELSDDLQKKKTLALIHGKKPNVIITVSWNCEGRNMNLF